MKDKFSDRMKMYERGSESVPISEWTEPLPIIVDGKVDSNFPVFVRLDGKAFHTWTKQMFVEKPFDKKLSKTFQDATVATAEEIGQVIMAYGQSDEVTFLLSGWQHPESQIYFDGKIQKIVSVISSIFTTYFNVYNYTLITTPKAFFDARVFNVPENEIENVFIWRQMDARRNSVSGLAQSLFSHRELQGKSTQEMMLMCLHEKGEDWNKLSNLQKWGFVVHKEKYEISDYDWGLSSDNITIRSRWIVDNAIPYFVENRDYIQTRLI